MCAGVSLTVTTRTSTKKTQKKSAHFDPQKLPGLPLCKFVFGFLCFFFVVFLVLFYKAFYKEHQNVLLKNHKKKHQKKHKISEKLGWPKFLKFLGWALWGWPRFLKTLGWALGGEPRLFEKFVLLGNMVCNSKWIF